MGVISRWARLPPDKELVETIERAGVELRRRLLGLDLAALPVSDYTKRYLADYQADLGQPLNVSAIVLGWALAGHECPRDQLVLVDHGGGCGLISLLARAAGVGCVIYNDIFAPACDDAKTIARRLGLEAQHYVAGEFSEVKRYLNQNDLDCQAIASSNVIEHIYDLDGFLRELSTVGSGPLSIAMASDANNSNPRLRRMLMRRQQAVESTDRASRWGDKPSDSRTSYLELRRQLIAKYAPEASADILERLAGLTRGLRQDDIQRCVEEWRQGRWPRAPTHPTNTCDPLTGNWCEHLLDQRALCKTLRECGFEASIISGCYGRLKRLILRPAALVLNVLSYVLGSGGVAFAPFFLLLGRSKEESKGGPSTFC